MKLHDITWYYAISIIFCSSQNNLAYILTNLNQMQFVIYWTEVFRISSNELKLVLCWAAMLSTALRNKLYNQKTN